MTREDLLAMATYLAALAIGFAIIMAFWQLWAIPQFQEVSTILEQGHP